MIEISWQQRQHIKNTVEDPFPSVNDEGMSKKGLTGEGTLLDLPINRHGNLQTASSDEQLSNILLQIKSSKTPVIPFFFFFLFQRARPNFVRGIYLFLSFLLNSLQAVINYGASWYVTLVRFSF